MYKCSFSRNETQNAKTVSRNQGLLISRHQIRNWVLEKRIRIFTTVQSRNRCIVYPESLSQPSSNCDAVCESECIIDVTYHTQWVWHDQSICSLCYCCIHLWSLVSTHTKHLDTTILPMYERRLCRQLNRGGFCIQVKSESAAAEQIFLRKNCYSKILNF